MTRTRSSTVRRVALTAILLSLLSCTDDATDAGSGTCSSHDASTEAFRVAPGVCYESYEVSRDGVEVHLLTVDLTSADLDVVSPGVVAHTGAPTSMAEDAGAVAVVNGDYFNNREDRHPTAPHTNAPVGPVVSGGEPLKGAVPDGQLMGPSRPQGGSTRSVFGITTEGRATITELDLRGWVRLGGDEVDLDALNQYAIPENGVGMFTSAWGWASRTRAVCGTDEDRQGACASTVLELTIEGGTVAEIRDRAGGGDVTTGVIGPDQTIVLARENAVERFEGVAVGDPVRWSYELVSDEVGQEFAEAIGGLPLIVDGEDQPIESPGEAAPRTAVGHSEDGRTAFLVVVEGGPDDRGGVNLTTLRTIMGGVGAHGALSLDGGGSSLMASTETGDDTLVIRNEPTDRSIERIVTLTSERPVANGLAVFAGHQEPADRRAGAVDDSFRQIVGEWSVVATSPGQASTITVAEDGSATYASEGTVVGQREGTAEPVGDGTFMVTFTPPETFWEEYGRDYAEPGELDITMQLEPGPDGDSLTAHADGSQIEYVRAEA